MTRVITGRHPKRGRYFAGVDEAARYVEAKLARSRFEARLAPFQTDAEARDALKAAGAKIEDPGR